VPNRAVLVKGGVDTGGGRAEGGGEGKETDTGEEGV